MEKPNPSPYRVLVAGANGSVGSSLIPLLRQRGYEVIALCRKPPRHPWASEVQVLLADALHDDLTTALRDIGRIDAAVSALGASVAANFSRRAPYSRVDAQANRRLLAALSAQPLQRFVYLACYVTEDYAQCAYVQAHETFVKHLQASGVPNSIVRPTGIFSALRELPAIAAKGRLAVIGDGSARTNPIHPLDVAEVCERALTQSTGDWPCGGPEVLTRRQIAELAAQACHARAQIRQIRPGIMDFAATVLGPFHPRMQELLRFATAVSTHDAIAPIVGTRDLASYFKEVVAS